MSSGGRLKQPTNVVAPGAPAAALQAQNDLNQILVDDTLQSQNPDPIVFGRVGNPLTASNTLRGGDTATDVVGVMTYTWAGNAASGNAYRVRPIGALGGGVPSFQPSNPRPGGAAGGRRVGARRRHEPPQLLQHVHAAARTASGGAATDCRGADNAGRVRPAVAEDGRGDPRDEPRRPRRQRDRERRLRPDSAIQFLVDKLNAGDGAGDVRVHRRGRQHGPGQRARHRRDQGGDALQARAR